jgi:hypothetical protein
MSDEIPTPIFLIDDFDVVPWDSATSAAGDLEVFDVTENGVQAFDARGDRLELYTEGWRVGIRRSSTPVNDLAGLTRRVRAYARSLAENRPGLPNVDTAGLPELASYISSILRPERKRGRGRRRHD